MLDPRKLGIPAAPVAAGDGLASSAAPVAKPSPIASGSPTAEAIHAAWRGDPVVIVDSPPGAGKTALIVTMTAWMVKELPDIRLAIITPTNAQVLALVHRLVREVPATAVCAPGKRLATADLPPGVSRSENAQKTRVVVQTVAAAGFSGSTKADVLIVDEAYQVTYADLTTAASQAHQVVLVGDPGQIGPVVTVDDTFWRASRISPTMRSPEGIRKQAKVTSVRIPVTWRLGATTAKVVAPIYPFAFQSCRPDRSLVTGGVPVPEVSVIEVEDDGRPDGLVAMSAVVDRVRQLVGSTLTNPAPGEGMIQPGGQVTLQPADIAVVAARNVQCSMLTGMLEDAGLADVVVGTADRLQGGQWAAVVAADPLIGSNAGSPHTMALGRLAVMLSRHTTHLSWVTRTDWRDALSASEDADPLAHKVRSVLAEVAGPVA